MRIITASSLSASCQSTYCPICFNLGDIGTFIPLSISGHPKKHIYYLVMRIITASSLSASSTYSLTCFNLGDICMQAPIRALLYLSTAIGKINLEQENNNSFKYSPHPMHTSTSFHFTVNLSMATFKINCFVRV